MTSQFTIISLLVIILSVVVAERNIVPSKEVCATFPNEEFLIDLTKCQNTCEFYGRVFDCPNYYKPKGDCYCKQGFARIAEDGKCVSVTKNATCVGRLPIQPDSCTGPNEIYSDDLTNTCDVSCLTIGCSGTYEPYPNRRTKWSPNCQCISNDYRRLSNGTCVVISSDECKAEYTPSPERCAAIGQLYKVNAPCQAACYNGQYCPLASGACVCPPNTIANIWNYGAYVYAQSVSITVDMVKCYSVEENCPIQPVAG